LEGFLPMHACAAAVLALTVVLPLSVSAADEPRPVLIPNGGVAPDGGSGGDGSAAPEGNVAPEGDVAPVGGVAPDDGIPARATEAPAAAAPAPAVARPSAMVRGRVLTRGSITPVPGATVTASSGETTTTDAHGRFALGVAAGDVELVIAEPRHEILRVHEALRPDEGVTVEYLLLPNGRHRFESTVRGSMRHEGQRFSLSGEELQTVPGALGDPFRTIGLMPGVTMPVTLLPLYVVRGASPGMNGFFIDGMRVPQLFHLLVGGGVINGRLVDRLDFYPSAYDASFGRFAGGIVDAATRPARRDGQHGEAQLRLFDASLVAELALPHDVGVTVSGSYGWPGLLIAVVAPGTDVRYGDYQLRIDWKALTVQALGSYDSISVAHTGDESGSSSDQFRLTFHRVQLRYHGRRQRLAYEAALIGAYDQMRAFGGNGVIKMSLGWRALVSARWSRLQLQAGVDGEVSRFRGENFRGRSSDLGELDGDRDGVVAGAFALVTIDWIPKRLTMTLSGRSDVYDAGGVTLIGLEPRLNLRAQLTARVSLTAGAGIYHQPPTFPVPLPGLDTFALRLGLQRAYHAALGAEATLPQAFTLSLTGYYQRFSNIGDATLDGANIGNCSPDPPEALKGASAAIMRQVNGQAYGGELLLRRHRGRVTGWIAYTVGRSERFLPCGTRPSDFDQTHTLNVVVQARLPRQLMLGGRLYVASGRPATRLDPDRLADTPRNNWRMPTYVQLDVRLDREWLFKRWALDLFVELVNVTYSQSAFGVEYPYDDEKMRQRYESPRVSGFRWVLPSIGARGRF
jgi:hypothetical protein